MLLDERKKKIIVIVFIVLAVAVLGTCMYIGFTGTTEDYNNFYNHKIAGELTAIHKEHSSIVIKLKNDNKDYQFYQENRSYLKRDLRKFTQLGDSIFKEAFSDTVIIKSGNRYYKYAIER